MVTRDHSERLSSSVRECPGNRDRVHDPRKGKGRNDESLPVLGYCHEAGKQLAGGMPRRVDLDDGKKAGLVQKINSSHGRAPKR
jgi:hypothetical protein